MERACSQDDRDAFKPYYKCLIRLNPYNRNFFGRGNFGYRLLELVVTNRSKDIAWYLGRYVPYTFEKMCQIFVEQTIDFDKNQDLVFWLDGLRNSLRVGGGPEFMGSHENTKAIEFFTDLISRDSDSHYIFTRIVLAWCQFRQRGKYSEIENYLSRRLSTREEILMYSFLVHPIDIEDL